MYQHTFAANKISCRRIRSIFQIQKMQRKDSEIVTIRSQIEIMFTAMLISLGLLLRTFLLFLFFLSPFSLLSHARLVILLAVIRSSSFALLSNARKDEKWQKKFFHFRSLSSFSFLTSFSGPFSTATLVNEALKHFDAVNKDNFSHIGMELKKCFRPSLSSSKFLSVFIRNQLSTFYFWSYFRSDSLSISHPLFFPLSLMHLHNGTHTCTRTRTPTMTHTHTWSPNKLTFVECSVDLLFFPCLMYEPYWTNGQSKEKKNFLENL